MIYFYFLIDPKLLIKKVNQLINKKYIDFKKFF